MNINFEILFRMIHELLIKRNALREMDRVISWQALKMCSWSVRKLIEGIFKFNAFTRETLFTNKETLFTQLIIRKPLNF